MYRDMILMLLGATATGLFYQMASGHMLGSIGMALGAVGFFLIAYQK